VFDPAWARAIASIESSGRYNLLGPVTASGDRAYGKYQVMGNNVGPWTKQHLGREMTPEEFLNDRDAQDQVFEKQFGSTAEKYGSPQEAASVWFTGRPMAQGANARDVLGTTGSGYVSKFNKALGLPAAPAVNAIDAAMGNKPATPTGAAMAFDTTPPPDDGFLGQLGNFVTGTNGGYNLADRLGNAGAAMMALDNAKGATALTQNMILNRKQQPKASEFQYDPKSGTFFRTGANGKLETMQNPNAEGAGPKAKISESSLKNVAKTMDDYDFINTTAGQAADILDDLKTGKLNLGMLNNPANSAKNMAGMSDDQSRAYARYTRFVQDLVNSNLRLNNGVQTEGDAWREMKSIAANGTSYDNKTAEQALERVIDKAKGAADRGIAHLETRKKTFGDEPFEPYNDLTQGWKTRLDAINERRKSYAQPEAPAAAAPAPGGFRVIKAH
jgi:hypothetical protein